MKINKELLQAAKEGNLVLIQELVKNGADVNYFEKTKPELEWSTDANRVLYNAIISDAEATIKNEIVKLLLEKGANPNETTDYLKFTPLHWACSRNNTEMARMLIEHKADRNAVNSDGKTPIQLTKSKEIKELINQVGGGNTDAKKEGLGKQLFIAAEKAALSTMKKLIKDGADIEYKDDYGEKTSLMAVMTPLNEKGKISDKAVEAFKWMIEEGNADINTKTGNGHTPLHQACAIDRLDLFKYLLDRGAKPTIDKFKNTLLHEAVAHTNNHDEKLWSYLLELRQDIDAKNEYGNTPLYEAVNAWNLNAVKFLVKNGSDTSIKNKKKQTALALAKELKNAKIIDYMESL